MILVGQYDSPYVRRVAVSLRVVGFDYEHDTRSVFADFDAMRQINPIGRIPSLVLAGSEVLIDSASILDWLDQTVGPERALVPPGGAERRRALRLIALATGAIDKAGAAAYERIIRPSAFRWPEWIDRCVTQATSAIWRTGGRALAGRGLPRSSTDHDRLHDTLRADGRSRTLAAGPLSCPRRPIGPLRGTAGVPGDLSRRLRAPAGRLRLKASLN